MTTAAVKTTTTAPALPISAGIDDPQKTFESRWDDVRARIASSGEHPDREEGDALADEIMVWVGKDGVRWNTVWPMMSSGHYKLKEAIAAAEKSLKRPYPKLPE